MRNILICLLCLLQPFPAALANETLRLVTTTSARSSGLLDILLPVFETEFDYKVDVVAVGSGKALRLARTGRADVVLTHDPAAERGFVADGYGLKRIPVMKNDFVLVGPGADPAGIHGATDVVAAFHAIREKHSLFVSRADDSGTHNKEQLIWSRLKIIPYGEWYFELGAGMGVSLAKADEMQAYILVDRGTWLAHRDEVSLVLHVEHDPVLENPYHVIVVNPDKVGGVNTHGAMDFVTWLTGAGGQSLISDFRIDNEILYVPLQPAGGAN